MKHTDKQIKEVGKQVLISLGRFSSVCKIEKQAFKELVKGIWFKNPIIL